MKLSGIKLFAAFFTLALVSCEKDTDQYAFDDWDNDTDNIVSEDEYRTAFNDYDYYNDWDLNDDGSIDEEEWETGINTNYPTYDAAIYGDFDKWNKNGDDQIDEDELVAGNFTVWDTDRDGNIEIAEYEEWTAEE